MGTPVSITGTAEDPTSNGVTSGVASVAVTVDSTSLTVTGATSWSAEWIPAAAGTYTITSVATDNVGNAQTTVTSITVVAAECVECVWNHETAWAAGDPHVEQGNWATYTSYVPDSTVTLFAGRTLEAGTVHFSAPYIVDTDVMITITVSLNPAFRFQDVAENVKIQDYAAAPSGNPDVGHFATKVNATGSSFSVENVPTNNFYGVHVDVEHCVK